MPRRRRAGWCTMYMSGLVGAIPDDPRAGRPICGGGSSCRAKVPAGWPSPARSLYVAEYFSDSRGAWSICEAVRDDVAGPDRPGTPPQLAGRRWGELLFNDATICRQQWQSCASCHPDGRSDVVNWDLLNDGVGNPKNTKSLVLAFQTPPSMAEGVRTTAGEAVRAGLSNILFADRPEAEAVAIDEYLQSLEPVPSPHLVDGQAQPGRRTRASSCSPASGPAAAAAIRRRCTPT